MSEARNTDALEVKSEIMHETGLWESSELLKMLLYTMWSKEMELVGKFPVLFVLGVTRLFLDGHQILYDLPCYDAIGD
jgi:hypothetical protein